LYGPIVRYGFVSRRVLELINLSARPPVAATSLYVEPGGYCSAIAWLRRGWVGSVRRRSKAARLIPLAKRLLS
jgi:hypothetical protein